MAQVTEATDSENESENNTIAPLSIETAKRPQYAASTQSGVSGISEVGHTYLQEMDRRNTALSSSEFTEASNCNRIYSYCDLLAFILHIALLSFLAFGYYQTYEKCSSDYDITNDVNNNECIGEITECNQSDDCSHIASFCQCLPDNSMSILLIVYMILSIFVGLKVLYRSCLSCYALSSGQTNQLWMNRIADNCCVAWLFCNNSNSCANKVSEAYFTAIDQYKAFPTTTSFVIGILVKILNILFCGGYIFLNGMNALVITFAALYILTLLVSMIRIQSKSSTQRLQAKHQLSMSVHSASSPR